LRPMPCAPKLRRHTEFCVAREDINPQGHSKHWPQA
jgi:hypothetical protein